jgi:hypothetical protein
VAGHLSVLQIPGRCLSLEHSGIGEAKVSGHGHGRDVLLDDVGDKPCLAVTSQVVDQSTRRPFRDSFALAMRHDGVVDLYLSAVSAGAARAEILIGFRVRDRE